MPEHGPDHGGSARPDRRAFLTKLGVGAAAAWTAPVLLSNPAPAGPGTPGTAPFFVPGSVATNDNAGEDNTISVGRPAAIQNGDLVLAIVAAGANRTIITPAGWTPIASPQTSGTSDFFGGDGVRAYVFWRYATAGVTSYSFTKNTFGGGAMTLAVVAYRGDGTVRVDEANGQAQSTGNTKQFPAVTAAPNRTVVRLGAGSNWAGIPAQQWTAWPAANVRVASAGYGGALGVGVGSRALTISDDASAAAANGTINQARPAVTFTVSLINDV